MRIENAKIAGLASQTPASKPPVSAEGDFGQKLMDAIKEVNNQQADSRELQNKFMAGQPVEFHELMIAMEKASTSMALTMQIRNKLLEAYQEISRMQV